MLAETVADTDGQTLGILKYKIRSTRRSRPNNEQLNMSSSSCMKKVYKKSILCKL